MNKKVLLIDMDGVVADFRKYILDNSTITAAEFDSGTEEVSDRVDEFCISNPTIFEYLEPIEGAIDRIKYLFGVFDVYFCSTPMYRVPESYKSKRIWLEKHFGELASRRLILTHRKDLIKGDILIDDRKVNGAANFNGLFIHFGSDKFAKNWKILNTKMILVKYVNFTCNMGIPENLKKWKDTNEFPIIFDTKNAIR